MHQRPDDEGRVDQAPEEEQEIQLVLMPTRVCLGGGLLREPTSAVAAVDHQCLGSELGIVHFGMKPGHPRGAPATVWRISGRQHTHSHMRRKLGQPGPYSCPLNMGLSGHFGSTHVAKKLMLYYIIPSGDLGKRLLRRALLRLLLALRQQSMTVGADRQEIFRSVVVMVAVDMVDVELTWMLWHERAPLASVLLEQAVPLRPAHLIPPTPSHGARQPHAASTITPSTKPDVAAPLAHPGLPTLVYGQYPMDPCHGP